MSDYRGVQGIGIPDAAGQWLCQTCVRSAEYCRCLMGTALKNNCQFLVHGLVWSVDLINQILLKLKPD